MKPQKFRRKPNKITFICPVVLALCLYFAITTEPGPYHMIYWLASVFLFLGGLFHVFTLWEYSYELTDTAFCTRSRLFVPEEVELSWIVSVEYRDESRKSLLITYDKPGFEALQQSLRAMQNPDETPQGMWHLEILAQDINVPLEELKFYFCNIILTREEAYYGKTSDQD